MTIKKVGGIRFMSIGRLSVSFCIKRKVAREPRAQAGYAGTGELIATLACGMIALYGLVLAFSQLGKL